MTLPAGWMVNGTVFRVLPQNDTGISPTADATSDPGRDPGNVGAHYELADAETGEILSKHRTQRAAIDAFTGPWGRRVKLFRLYSTGELRLLAEGRWYEGGGIPVPVTRHGPDSVRGQPTAAS